MVKLKQADNHQKIESICVLILLVWSTSIVVAGMSGFFSSIPLPFIAVIAVTGMVIPVLAYYFNKPFKTYIESIDFKHLTVFHLWRIIAAIVFFEYGSQYLLPRIFVINAAYGDAIAGSLVSIVLLDNVKGNSKYLVFHIFSLLDFVVAVSTGLTLTIKQVPLIETIATYPIVLIPLFGVPVTGALSIMTLDRLIRERQISNSVGIGLKSGK